MKSLFSFFKKSYSPIDVERVLHQSAQQKTLSEISEFTNLPKIIVRKIQIHLLATNRMKIENAKVVIIPQPPKRKIQISPKKAKQITISFGGVAITAITVYWLIFPFDFITPLMELFNSWL